MLPLLAALPGLACARPMPGPEPQYHGGFAYKIDPLGRNPQTVEEQAVDWCNYQGPFYIEEISTCPYDERMHSQWFPYYKKELGMNGEWVEYHDHLSPLTDAAGCDGGPACDLNPYSDDMISSADVYGFDGKRVLGKNGKRLRFPFVAEHLWVPPKDQELPKPPDSLWQKFMDAFGYMQPWKWPHMVQHMIPGGTQFGAYRNPDEDDGGETRAPGFRYEEPPEYIEDVQMHFPGQIHPEGSTPNEEPAISVLTDTQAPTATEIVPVNDSPAPAGAQETIVQNGNLPGVPASPGNTDVEPEDENNLPEGVAVKPKPARYTVKPDPIATSTVSAAVKTMWGS